MLSSLLFHGLLALLQVTGAWADAADLPLLKLPWGSYQGRPMKDDPAIILFENVRFGANPVRFGAPEFPSWTNSSIQPVKLGRNCIQVDPNALDTAPGGDDPVDTPDDQVTKQGEDCLFLDLYVPKTALDGTLKKPLPVVVWLYGGAYAFGSKNQLGPLYTGRSVITASKYQMIFVAGNYRLGAYGWLSGDYMQKHGQPNAGLYDQALLFQWVQKYIEQVSGDKSQVSAWGESAGAGSILHHLIREDGAVDPTFKTFAVQSPAFEWSWDNRPMGTLDQVYQNFSSLAGCGKAFDIDCLRKSKNLTAANQQLFTTVRQTGLFPNGPAVDGKWIKRIPTLSFASGKYWKSSIKSTIVSHCANEAFSFTPSWVDSSDTFDEFLAIFIPGDNLAPQRKSIADQYDCFWSYDDYTACIQAVIQDASFTCNTRDLFSAYPDKSHMLRFGFPLNYYARHASDLVALFANNYEEAVDLLVKNNITTDEAEIYADQLVDKNVALAYQTYFASFAIAGGDPNTLDMPTVDTYEPPKWPVADGSEDQLQNVLTVQLPVEYVWEGFVLGADDQNAEKTCAFWTRIAEEVEAATNKLVGSEQNDEL